MSSFWRRLLDFLVAFGLVLVLMVKNRKGTDAVSALVPFFLFLLEHEWPRMEHESYKNWVLRCSGLGWVSAHHRHRWMWSMNCLCRL